MQCIFTTCGGVHLIEQGQTVHMLQLFGICIQLARHIYIYICICVYMYIYILYIWRANEIYMPNSKYICIYICIYTHIHMCIHIYLLFSMYIQLARLYIYININICMYIYISICIYIYCLAYIFH